MTRLLPEGEGAAGAGPDKPPSRPNEEETRSVMKGT